MTIVNSVMEGNVNELETIRRKIQLERQGVRFCRNKIVELQMRYALIKSKSLFEKRISEKFDPVLSRKLDCVSYLLEN